MVQNNNNNYQHQNHHHAQMQPQQHHHHHHPHHRRGGVMHPHSDGSGGSMSTGNARMDLRKSSNSSSHHHHQQESNSHPDGGLSFPLKLHAMLDDAERKGFTNIVSWQPGNKSFRVHDAIKFGTEIMPQWFNQTKFKSFQRQLNIYGYRRIQHGPLKGGYVHKCFVRGKPELSAGVTRRSNNAEKAKAAASAVAAKVMEMVTVQGNRVQVAPHADARELESVLEDLDFEPIKNIAASVDFGSCNLQGVLDRIFQEEETDQAQLPQQQHQEYQQHQYGSSPSAVKRSSFTLMPPSRISQKPSCHYRTASGVILNMDQANNHLTGDEDIPMEDFLGMLATAGDQHYGSDASDGDGGGHESWSSSSSLAEAPSSSAVATQEQEDDEEETEEQLSERIFPLKLHRMLEGAHREGIEHIVSWVDNGRGFKVHNSKLFTEQVMPMWFDQTKYESFRRQLNLYNFSRISRGPQRGVYSHPSFVTGRRDLLGNVLRKINGEINPKAAAMAAATAKADNVRSAALSSNCTPVML